MMILNKKTLNKIKDYNVAIAKIYCPEDKGDMKDSIHGKVIGNTIVVGTDIEYGPMVEFGTDTMINAHGEHNPKNPVTEWAAKTKRGDSGTPQQMPFLRPAAYIVQKTINKMLPKKMVMEVSIIMK